ncbi:MAG: hypothetical protein GY679_01815 [Mycoplasma sp.]|nr:hypothetical protein [Mycoplasma sp.]
MNRILRPEEVGEYENKKEYCLRRLSELSLLFESFGDYAFEIDKHLADNEEIVIGLMKEAGWEVTFIGWNYEREHDCDSRYIMRFDPIDEE